MHLRPPGFVYGAYEPFTKTNGKEKNVRETCVVYKACFEHDLAYDRNKNI